MLHHLHKQKAKTDELLLSFKYHWTPEEGAKCQLHPSNFSLNLQLMKNLIKTNWKKSSSIRSKTQGRI